MNLIFVRHGKDDSRYRGGWSNLDLIPEGIAQAERLAAHLQKHNSSYKITQILSSDLTRTMTTAKLIASELELPIQPEPRIRETNNGDLAGMANEIALVTYPGLFFSSLSMDEHYPNGESPEEFYHRIALWFSEFSSGCRHCNGNILIVTHNGVINVIYHLVKGLKWSNKVPPFKADPCSIHILNLDTMKFETENLTV